MKQRLVDRESVRLSGVKFEEHPEYQSAYVAAAAYVDGEELDEHELDQLTEDLYSSDTLVYFVYAALFNILE